MSAGLPIAKGSGDTRFLYADIISIRLKAEQLAYFGGIYRRRVYRVDLSLRSGDQISLDGRYSSIEKLGDQLNQQILAHLQPIVEDKLANSEKVYFSDDLYITNAGIYVELEANDTHHLSWQDFGGYTAAKRQLSLLRTDNQGWFALPLSEVDNLILFVKLLKQHQKILN